MFSFNSKFTGEQIDVYILSNTSILTWKIENIDDCFKISKKKVLGRL